MRRNFFTTLMTLMLVSLFAVAAFAQTVNMDDPKMAPVNSDRTAMEATGDPAIPLQSNGELCITCARKDLASGCGAHREYSDSFCKQLESDLETAVSAKKNDVVH
jgi:hypothetical protein